MKEHLLSRLDDLTKKYPDTRIGNILKNTEAKEKAENYLETNPFLNNDDEYAYFIRTISGIKRLSGQLEFGIYGFDSSVMPSIYLEHNTDSEGYLCFGNMTACAKDPFICDAICYFFQKKDKIPKVYIRYHPFKEPPSKFVYLCTGFLELLSIISTKSFQEQISLFH